MLVVEHATSRRCDGHLDRAAKCGIGKDECFTSQGNILVALGH